MSAFLISFLVIFVAELGDKSQLVALWFATKYRWWVALAGIAFATAVLNLGAVVIGRTVDALLPERVLLIIVGLSFFVFAALSLRADEQEDHAERQFPVFGAFGVVAASFFVSELGDKTQLATISLAGDRTETVGVWLGSTAGIVAADALAIGVGIVTGSRLPRRAIAIGAAALFCVFGAAALVKAFV